MFAGSFAPAGWAFCNGALLPISENDTLFNLIGTTYGGDGQSTFALPNLSSRYPIHQGTSPTTGTTYQIGEASGNETVTLTTNQIPVHSHAALASSDPGNSGTPSNSVWAKPSAAAMYTQAANNTTENASAVQSSGGSQPHDNMMPFLCVSFIISLFGIFPPQN
jgi:microcystin-dependent protein